MGVVLGYAEPQVGDPSLTAQLPGMLNDVEKQSILRERDPKPHVESALKVAEARIKNAMLLTQESQMPTARQDLDAFLALVIYADTYARKALVSKNKDRNHCLKRIEQAVFKQSRNLDSIMRALPLESREAAEVQIGEVKKIRLRAINDLLGQGQVINSPN
jgi:Mg2+/Co2+ transporter CorC